MHTSFTSNRIFIGSCLTKYLKNLYIKFSLKNTHFKSIDKIIYEDSWFKYKRTTIMNEAGWIYEEKPLNKLITGTEFSQIKFITDYYES